MQQSHNVKKKGLQDLYYYVMFYHSENFEPVFHPLLQSLCPLSLSIGA